jgi:hypothetical protein
MYPNCEYDIGMAKEAAMKVATRKIRRCKMH